MLKINFLTKYLIISKLGEYKKFLNIILLKASEKIMKFCLKIRQKGMEF